MSDCQGLEEEGDGGVIANGCEFPFWDDGNILKLVVIFNSEYTKNH